MRNIFTLIFLVFINTIAFASSKTLIVPAKKATEIYIPINKNGQKISYMQLSQMKVKDYELMTGHKLSFLDKVKFKIAQTELRKTINPDLTINSNKIKSLVGKVLAYRDHGDSHHYFRLFIVLLAITIALGVIALFVPWVWWLSAIGFIFTVVFFILWLVSLA